MAYWPDWSVCDLIWVCLLGNTDYMIQGGRQDLRQDSAQHKPAQGTCLSCHDLQNRDIDKEYAERRKVDFPILHKWPDVSPTF